MTDGGIEYRTEVDLARDLRLARARPGHEGSSGRGHAIFLVGAGCSVSAEIPAAAGVAQRCAIKLREMYDVDWTTERRKAGQERPDDPIRTSDIEAEAISAVRWLISKGHLADPRPDDRQRTDHWEGADWGELYPIFFEDHLKAPNVQRELITEIVEASGNRLNWTYACLGELVAQRIVHTVLTTNFDQLVLNGIIRAGTSPVIADGPYSFNRILPSPPFPQIVHLHGSMHTYNLRNSRKAVVETQEDKGTLTMVHGLLQQCNVLVVVGYAGGEEGLMQILLEASERLENLVVYWVVYEGREPLSPNCNRLMRGENKFVVEGGPSDKFFFELMSALGIGPPRWVTKPVGGAATELGTLQASADIPYAVALMEGHDGRIARAVAYLAKNRTSEDAYHDALAEYAAGRYGRVLELLTGEREVELPRALRLRATAAMDVAQREPDEDRRHLRRAIGDFERLVAAPDGDPDTTAADLVGLVNALRLAVDGDRSVEERVVNLRRIDDVAGKGILDPEAWRQIDDSKSVNRKKDLAYLLSSRAEALIGLVEAERSASSSDQGHASDDPEAKRLSQDHIDSYEEAKTLYERVKDLASDFEVEGQATSEAREGLAAIRQSLALHDASFPDDPDKKETAMIHAAAAVEERDKVVGNAWRSPSSAEDGGMQINLASALSVQWELADWVGRRALRQKGRDAAMRAVASFERLGDADRVVEARTLARKFAAT